MRIALLQGLAGLPTTEDSLAALDDAARRVAAAGARLLLTCELYTSG